MRGGLRKGQVAVGAVGPPHEVRDDSAWVPTCRAAPPPAEYTRRSRRAEGQGHGCPQRAGQRDAARVTGEMRQGSLGGPRP